MRTEPMLLTDREKRVIEEEVSDLIVADATYCEIWRPVRAGDGSFHGGHEVTETVVAHTLPIEFLPGSPEGVTQEGADAVANIVFDDDVQENDFVTVFGDDVRYRVTNVEVHRAFGAQSHKTLTLEREYRKQA